MKLRQHQNAIAVLVACGLFLAVAVQFFFASPILEGLDVPAHYQYVLTLERGRHFPDPHASDVVRTSAHESVEYPLYYLIGAAITWRVPTGDLDQIAIPNPHFLDPRLGANRNAFFHRPFDGIPSGAELSARILELLSLSLGMVSVGSTVLLARALFPKRPTVWLSSGLLLVGLPAFDFLFVSVTNDTLVIALSTIVCLLLVLWVKHGRTRFGLLAAVALTGAVLTKANAFGLVVPYSVAVFNTQDSLAKRARFLGCLVGLILLVDGWWLIHMLATFGDLTGVSWLKQRFPEGPGPLFSVPLGVSLSNAVHEIPHLLSTIFINFNTDSEWSRLVPESALFVGLAAGCFSVREWLREPGTRQLAAPLIAWLLTMALEVAYWLTMYDAPGRLIYPAMAPVVVCAAAGWQWLSDRLRIGGGEILVSGTVVLTAGLTAWLVTAPMYRYPERVRELPSSVVPANVTFDNAVQLIGFESAPAEVPAEGGTVSLTLYWRLERPIDTALSTFVHVDPLDPAYSPEASYDGAVGHGTYPPNFWTPGEIVEDPYQLHLKARPSGSGPNAIPLSVRVGMYQASPSGGIQHVPTIPPDASNLGAEITHWKIQSKDATAVGPGAASLATFQNGLELLGAESRMLGSDVTVTLHWLARSVPTENATVFVQALDPDGQLLGQHDAYPNNGHYPTGLLSVGEELTDAVTLRLHRPLTGRDQLILGMYVLPEAGKRIPTTDGRTVVALPR